MPRIVTRMRLESSRTDRRTIALEGRIVEFALSRSRRKTIGITVDHRGLRVGAPMGAGLADIEALLRKHRAWVLDKLANRAAQQMDVPSHQVLRDGSVVPWLGRSFVLSLVTTTGRTAVQGSPDDACLTLALRQGEAPAKRLERVLRDMVRPLLAQRLVFYAGRLGVEPPPLSLSSARTRWGSCSTRTGIRLNWRLCHFPMSVIDYVVAHEVAHLVEMNHSPRFWAVVGLLVPDWRERRQQLKQLARSVPVF